MLDTSSVRMLAMAICPQHGCGYTAVLRINGLSKVFLKKYPGIAAFSFSKHIKIPRVSQKLS
jgi:hypothetical protein